MSHTEPLSVVSRALKYAWRFLFHNQGTRQTVAKNTFWLSVSQVGGRVVRMIIIIYAARILGAGPYGIFSYATSLAAFLTVFTDIGINSILVREIAKEHDEKKRKTLLATSFAIKLVLLAIGILLVLVVAPQVTTIDAVNAILPLTAAILAFDTLREFGFSLIRGKEKMEWEAGLYILTNVGIVVMGFILLQMAPSVESFTSGYAAGTAIGALATFAVLRRDFLGTLTHFSRAHVLPILSAAWPFAISGLLGMLMLNTDILIIGATLDAEAVGQYSAAQRVIQFLYNLPAILSVSLLPTLARLVARQEKEKMREALERTVSFMYMIALPVAIGGIILGKYIMLFLFGEGYLSGISSFQILSLTLLADFPALILTSVIFSHNRQKALIINGAIGGGVNVVMDIILIPLFGITGSAIATLVAQICSNIYLWHKARSIVSFHIMRHLKKIAIAALVMAGVVYAINGALPVVVTVIVGAGVYFAVLAAQKEKLLKEILAILRPGV